MNNSALDQVAEHLLGEGWVSAEDAARCARLVQEVKDLLLGTMTEEEAGEAQELLAQALLFLPDADLC